MSSTIFLLDMLQLIVSPPKVLAFRESQIFQRIAKRMNVHTCRSSPTGVAESQIHQTEVPGSIPSYCQIMAERGHEMKICSKSSTS